ncbi:MAG: hypothetical protein V1871_02710 [Planctomycetota bacterium]
MIATIEKNQCRECERQLRGWEHRVIRLCKRCYDERFPKREISLPPLRRKVAGGWQRLFSAEERNKSGKWIDEIIEKVDRENQSH